MVFIDNITPTNQQYQDATSNYYGSGNETTRQRANDWATMYYQNAYNTAMTNYMNEYNSPLQQMLRYQAAGINPNLAATDPGNMGSAPSAAAPRGSTDRGPTTMDQVQASLQAVNTIRQAVQAATDVYDYFQYGREASAWKNLNLSEQNSILAANALRYQSEADWSRYWNFGSDSVDPATGNIISGSPRARYMAESTQLKSAQISQLQSIVGILYPSQAEANTARAAIVSYQKQVLQGQNDAILQINTGNKTADSILQMLAFKLLNTNISIGL